MKSNKNAAPANAAAMSRKNGEVTVYLDELNLSKATERKLRQICKAKGFPFPQGIANICEEVVLCSEKVRQPKPSAKKVTEAKPAPSASAVKAKPAKAKAASLAKKSSVKPSGNGKNKPTTASVRTEKVRQPAKPKKPANKKKM